MQFIQVETKAIDMPVNETPDALTGGVESINRLYTKMGTITPQDIMSAAKKYFVPEQRTVVVVRGGQS